MAERLGVDYDAGIRPVWHHDSEPAPVAHLGGRFLHLTQGFELVRRSGEPLCALVDDVTITADLDVAAPAPAGWLRLLTDDPRIARLLEVTCDPGDPLDAVLEPVAALWGEPVETVGSVRRLDARGATVALAAPSGSERERPCEVVTPPITAGHHAALEALLAPARDLGFTVPAEAAVHLHVDGAPFRDASALANLIRLFGWWRQPLRQLFGTNPACKRLKALPEALVSLVEGTPTYDALVAAAKAGGLSKFYDVNLTQVLRPDPVRDTVEIRILPGAIDAGCVIEQAAVLEALLDRCLEAKPIPRPGESNEAAEFASWLAGHDS